LWKKFEVEKDFELIKKILIEIESFSDDQYRNIKIEGFTKQKIDYHMYLLEQKNLIEAQNWKNTACDDWKVSKLTWAGQDFLAAAKNETVWKKAK
jgi:hypothetical protein